MYTLNRHSLLAALVLVSFTSLGSANLALAAGPSAVNLGSAGNFTILSKTGISTTGSTSVVGDIGVSPVAASYLTGFALTLPSASAFSTSALVTGKIYASDYAAPTPSTLTTAVSDMETAYTDASGRTNPTATELGAGNIGGLTIAPGLYKWGTGVTIPSNVTLSGSASDVWIFQIAQGLDVASGVNVQLTGGAQASNVYWVVAGQTTLNTTSVMNGNILDKTAIVLKTGAQLNGRALAQTAVTLDSNAVTGAGSSAPSSPVVVVTPTPTPTQTQTPTTPSPTTQNSSPVIATNVTVTTDPLVALQATIMSLKAQILAAQGQVNVQNSGASMYGQGIRSVAINMRVGSRGSEVQALQQFLISQNKGSSARALGTAGATAYFGQVTRSALAEYQAQVGISPASGNFGPITRAYINANN